jgi:hypothetical protein
LGPAVALIVAVDKDDLARAMAEELGRGVSLSEAARDVARHFGVSRSETYRVGLALRGREEERETR